MDEIQSIAAEDAIARVMSLPPAERFSVVQDLCSSLESKPSAVPVTDWQLAEIRRRKAAADADPSSLLSEDEFWRQVDAE